MIVHLQNLASYPVAFSVGTSIVVAPNSTLTLLELHFSGSVIYVSDLDDDVAFTSSQDFEFNSGEVVITYFPLTSSTGNLTWTPTSIGLSTQIFEVPVVGDVEIPGWVRSPEMSVFLLGFAFAAGVILFRVGLRWFRRADGTESFNSD